MGWSALVIGVGSWRGVCAEILKSEGFEAHVADSASRALTILESAKVDVIRGPVGEADHLIGVGGSAVAIVGIL